MHPMAGPDELEHPFGQLDAGIDVARLLVSVRDHGRVVDRSPLDVEGHGHRRPVRPSPRLGRVIQEHTVGLVADTPLPERNVASVVGPHLRRLDLQPVAQPGCVELFDVEVRRTSAHQPRPVVIASPAQLQPDEQTGGGTGVPTPPPPCFDSHIGVTSLVGGSEQHLDPAD